MSNCALLNARSSPANAWRASNSVGFTFARSFFSNPNTKNQRSTRRVATSVRAPARLPRPGNATRYFKTSPPRSASTSPRTISSTAAHSAPSVNSDFFSHRANERVLKTRLMVKVCHSVTQWMNWISSNETIFPQLHQATLQRGHVVTRPALPAGSEQPSSPRQQALVGNLQAVVQALDHPQAQGPLAVEHL